MKSSGILLGLGLIGTAWVFSQCQPPQQIQTVVQATAPEGELPVEPIEVSSQVANANFELLLSDSKNAMQNLLNARASYLWQLANEQSVSTGKPRGEVLIQMLGIANQKMIASAGGRQAFDGSAQSRNQIKDQVAEVAALTVAISMDDKGENPSAPHTNPYALAASTNNFINAELAHIAQQRKELEQLDYAIRNYEISDAQ